VAAHQRFRAVPVKSGREAVLIPVPFDPDTVWGPKTQHRVGGTVGGHRIRASIEPTDVVPEGRAVRLTKMWLRDCPVVVGVEVEVSLFAEGPQRADLAPDLAAALEADPEAGAFFDDLAQFYRKAYLRWIDATTKRPDVRAERIAEVVRLCAAGVKERPKTPR
jgi:hypothetical protein